ncbi:hypothetical protein GWK47_050124 [Chionoecetes opilio]|uniref:Uncharacterized protein n=1 Tax=Chionoecetes opilio TaxID=41210 RepID=A0A8J4YB28_CHIOP|nr:hypothetical protein GWK47_050124 [Chionoecetes opilio]
MKGLGGGLPLRRVRAKSPLWKGKKPTRFASAWKPPEEEAPPEQCQPQRAAGKSCRTVTGALQLEGMVDREVVAPLPRRLEQWSRVRAAEVQWSVKTPGPWLPLSHFRLSWADRSLGSRLGLAKSSISSSSRTSRPPASASMSSASIVLTVEQDLAVSSVPHHDRDSQVEDLPAGSVAPTAGPHRLLPLSPVPPSESVVVEDDYLVCSDGEEDAALPVPKRRRFGDFRPLASCPPGPSSAFSSEVPSRCTSPSPAAEDALGLPPSSSVLFTWEPMPPSIACETVDGRLVAIGRLEDGSWGPVPDLEVRRSREDGGQESFLYRRIPFSRLNAPSKQPAVFFGGPLWMLWPPYWLSLVWSGMASRAWREARMPGGFSRGPRPVALDEGRPGTLPKCGERYHQCEPGSFSVLGPIPVLPGLWTVSAGGFREGVQQVFRWGSSRRRGSPGVLTPVWMAPRILVVPVGVGLPGFRGSGSRAFRSGPLLSTSLPQGFALASEPPFQGLLSGFRAAWPQRGWAARVVQNGLSWPWIALPPLRRPPSWTPVSTVLAAHVSDMHSSGVVEKARGKVFLSRISIVPKKDSSKGRLISAA